MLRNIVLCIAGLFLTLVLISFLGWLHLHYSEQGRLMQDMLAGRISQAEYAEAFFDGVESRIFITEFVQLPIVVLITSGFVGFFARKKAWLPALFAITPVFMFVYKLDLNGILQILSTPLSLYPWQRWLAVGVFVPSSINLRAISDAMASDNYHGFGRLRRRIRSFV